MDRLLFETQKPLNLEVVRELRHVLEKVLHTTVPNDRVRKQILLCLSEAVTNLVLHATPKAEQVAMRFGRDSLGWRLEILDDGAPWDPTEHNQVDFQSNVELVDNGRGTILLHTQSDKIEYNRGDGAKLNRLQLHWLLPKTPQRPTILIVEDDNALRCIYAIYLAENFEVQTASNGHEALERINAGEIDLILSDINMPEMTGLSLRKELKHIRGTDIIPFIFITAYDNARMQKRAVNLGIDDYLVKPVDKARLIYTINRVLGRSRQIYQQLTNRIEKNITSALAPKLPTTAHGWRLCVASRNTGVGGGDLLLYQECETLFRLVLVDIMGHDDSAKFFAHACGGYLHGMMQALETDSNSAQLLERLSKFALQDKLLSQVTLTCCSAVLFSGGIISLASAGHPPPIHITSNGIKTVPVGGMIPGLLPDTTYQAETLHLGVGERIALFTDGLIESADNEVLRRQLEDRITAALVDTLDEPIDRALSNVMDIFDQFAGTPPVDDVLLVLIEPDEITSYNLQ